MSSHNSTLSNHERSRSEVLRFGNPKFGVYETEVARRQEEQEEIAAAETSDGFITVKARKKGKKKTTEQQQCGPKKAYGVCGNGYAAFEDTDDDEYQHSEADTTPASVTIYKLPNKRSYAEAMTTNLGGSGEREANLKKPTWFEMCESEDED